MNDHNAAVLRVCLTSICLLLCCTAHGTRAVPPTLTEVVGGSEHIGLVTIRSAEDYSVTDSEGRIWCGIIYEGDWVDSLTGDSERTTFMSKQVLEVRGRYLIYLAEDRLPRKLLSTNSRSEANRARLIERGKHCRRSKKLPRTIFKASKFVDETWLADDYKTGTWVEFPHFSESTLTEIIIKPTGLNIDAVVLTRDQFIDEFYDESKHQVIRTVGYELIIFRAVDWAEYCAALVDAVQAQNGPPSGVDQTNPTFCEKKPWTRLAGQ